MGGSAGGKLKGIEETILDLDGDSTDLSRGS